MMYDPVVFESAQSGTDKVDLVLKCKRCGETTELSVTTEQYDKLRRGNGHIQDILNDVPAGIREMFLSGYCNKCWKEIFPRPAEDEDEDEEEDEDEDEESGDYDRCATCVFNGVGRDGRSYCAAAQGRMSMDKFLIDAGRLYAVWYERRVTKESVPDLKHRASELIERLNSLISMWDEYRENNGLTTHDDEWCSHFMKKEEQKKED